MGSNMSSTLSVITHSLTHPPTRRVCRRHSSVSAGLLRCVARSVPSAPRQRVLHLIDSCATSSCPTHVAVDTLCQRPVTPRSKAHSIGWVVAGGVLLRSCCGRMSLQQVRAHPADSPPSHVLCGRCAVYADRTNERTLICALTHSLTRTSSSF